MAQDEWGVYYGEIDDPVFWQSVSGYRRAEIYEEDSDDPKIAGRFARLKRIFKTAADMAYDSWKSRRDDGESDTPAPEASEGECEGV